MGSCGFSINKFKVWLVDKGFTQKEGVDYVEAFSLMVRFSSIRMILSIVAHVALELHQMDVKTSFLNGNPDEEIYMKQPIGYVEKGQEDKVCKLNKSIYDFKQSIYAFTKSFIIQSYQMVSPCVIKIIVLTLSNLNINLCCYPFTLMIFFWLTMTLDF